MTARDDQIEEICAAIIDKHEKLVEKHKARIKRMMKSGDMRKMDTPLWMQTWDQPVLMYRNDAHLTLEDVVEIVIRQLEDG